MATRVGFGYDVHEFTEGRPLILGGITIPYEYGLVGHSDADAVIHAIVDALLGAAALGDIGMHFPPSNPRWKDQASTLFLEYTLDLLAQEGWAIGNIDVTIVTERPKMSPHIAAMRTHLAQYLKLEIGQISIKATTSEGRGFIGRREGLACYAIALIETITKNS